MQSFRRHTCAMICGIYGFHITRPIQVAGLRIEPRTTSHQQATEWARDQRIYHLTAIAIGESFEDSQLFDFEAVLAFIEHMDVIVTSPQEFAGSEPFAAFPATISAHQRRSGGGEAVGKDTFFPESRPAFIEKCLARLRDPQFCADTQFRALLFKKVETFRQREIFLEVSYFFLYSGLETYARAVLRDGVSRSASEPICCLLKRFGFDVDVERPGELPRAISTYTHLRNALFHNSQLEASVNINGSLVRLTIGAYMYNLTQLVTLVVLKAVDFDDGYTNWNSWIDHQR